MLTRHHVQKAKYLIVGDFYSAWTVRVDPVDPVDPAVDFNLLEGTLAGVERGEFAGIIRRFNVTAESLQVDDEDAWSLNCN